MLQVQLNSKGQEISEAIYLGFPYSKKPTKFLQIPALASKMGQIKKYTQLLL